MVIAQELVVIVEKAVAALDDMRGPAGKRLPTYFVDRITLVEEPSPLPAP